MTERERYEAAWAARRQRYWIYYGGLAILFAVAATARLLHTARLLRMSDNAGIGLGVGCIVAIILLSYWLYRFRCPRCGEVFWSQWMQKPRILESGPQKCEHCGLAVNEIPSPDRR